MAFLGCGPVQVRLAIQSISHLPHLCVSLARGGRAERVACGEQEEGRSQAFPQALAPGSTVSAVVNLPAGPVVLVGVRHLPSFLRSGDGPLLCPSNLETDSMVSCSADRRANFTSSVPSMVPQVVPSSLTLASESLAGPNPLPGPCRTTVLPPTPCFLPSLLPGSVTTSSLSHLQRTFQRHPLLCHSSAQTITLSHPAPCASFSPWQHLRPHPPTPVPSLSCLMPCPCHFPWVLVTPMWQCPMLASHLNCQAIPSSFLCISPWMSSSPLTHHVPNWLSTLPSPSRLFSVSISGRVLLPPSAQARGLASS